MQLQPSALNAPLNTQSNSDGSSNTVPSNLTGSTTGLRASPIANIGRAERTMASRHIPAVVIPRGSRLTSSLTYSDLSDGYGHVDRQPDLFPVPDGNDVRLRKRLVQYIDDPDSLTIVLAVPSRRPGVMQPVFGIEHCKLRYLFNDAISWSLTRDRLRFQEGALAIYTDTSGLDGDDRILDMLPKELTAVEVHANDLNCDGPKVKFMDPEGTVHSLFYGALTVLAGILFIELLTFFTSAAFRATMSSAYDAAVLVMARELYHFIAGIDFFVWSVGHLVMQGGLCVATFFREVRENVDV